MVNCLVLQVLVAEMKQNTVYRHCNTTKTLKSPVHMVNYLLENIN